MKKSEKKQPRKYDRYRNLNTSYAPSGKIPPDNHSKIDGQSMGKRSRNQNLEKKDKKFWSFSWKKLILIIFLIIIVPILIILIWDLKNFSKASSKLFDNSNVFGVLNQSELKTSPNGKTNILLIGYSADDPGHSGAELTDSIMVVSLDSKTKTGKTLSIPRDLYVDIPDYGSAKINEAFQAGKKQTGSKNGGAKLLEKVIADNLGIDIQYYIIVDYGAVRNIVDALGGITVNIDSKDKRGIYDPNFLPKEGGPLKLSNGSHKIDGKTALRLTRARGSTYGSYGFPQSDFNRTQNQQKVFAAIKNEITWRLVLNPRKNGKIFNALAENVETDIKLSEVLPLFKLVRSIPDNELKSITLNDINKVNYLTGYRTPSNQSALIPSAGLNNYSQIKSVLNKLGF